MNKPFSPNLLTSDEELAWLKRALEAMDIENTTRRLKQANDDARKVIHPYFNEERRRFWKQGD